MEADLKSQAREVDEWIRRGMGNHARARLGLLTRPGAKPLPQAETVVFAALARRALLPGLSLRLLNPIVRPPVKHPQIASELERAEYAAALIAVGAPSEALSILSGLNAQKNPEVGLYRAFALMTFWDYASTIPLLEAYVCDSRLSAYQSLVGKVNLAAALVFEQRGDEAERILSELVEETARQKHWRLHGNALELLAQQAIAARRWKRAESYLQWAEKLLREWDGLDELFVWKWRAISRGLQGRTALAFRELDRVREEACLGRRWETVRDCDFYRAVTLGERRRLLHLYFGTPHASFRARILREGRIETRLPERYRWTLGDRGPAARGLNLTGPCEGPRQPPEGLLRNLLLVLCSDFYRPLRLASLHSQLYPQEYFNPCSSPGRVHQAIRRLKIWCRAQNLPLRIVEQSGAYRLASDRLCAIDVPRDACALAGERKWVQRLKVTLPRLPFKAREASRALGISHRSANRLLRRAEAEKLIERHGKSSATFFSFVS